MKCSEKCRKRKWRNNEIINERISASKIERESPTASAKPASEEALSKNEEKLIEKIGENRKASSIKEAEEIRNRRRRRNEEIDKSSTIINAHEMKWPSSSARNNRLKWKYYSWRNRNIYSISYIIINVIFIYEIMFWKINNEKKNEIVISIRQ